MITSIPSVLYTSLSSWVSPNDIKDRLIRGGETRIGLNICQIDRSSATADECAEATAEALSHSDCRVAETDFSQLEITDNGAESLGRAISNSTTLATLCLSGSRISAVGVRAIAQGASQSCSLTNISLGVNPAIGPKGISALAEFNPPLQSVSLVNTGIGDAGMPLVAAFLRSTETLQYLHLDSNGFSDTGPIADALSVNSTLQRVYICGATTSETAGFVDWQRRSSTILTWRRLKRPAI